MSQTIINLDKNQEKFLNTYKAEKGLKNKNSAINQILKEYQIILEKDKEDKIFEKKVKEILKEYDKSSNKKKFTKEEFLEELKTSG